MHRYINKQLILNLDQCFIHSSEVKKAVNKCIKNRIKHHISSTHMNTKIYGGNPIWEKTTAAVVSVFNIYYIKKKSYNHVLAQTHTSTQAPTCRSLQPSLIYQPLLEGSYNPLIFAPASTGRKLLLLD